MNHFKTSLSPPLPSNKRIRKQDGEAKVRLCLEPAVNGTTTTGPGGLITTMSTH